MLTLYHNGLEYPIQNTEYYIRELANGLDEVIFDISIYDPIYQVIQEEEAIKDRGGQTYLVKQIDAGADTARIICQIDIDAWKAQMFVDYDSGTKTCVQQLEAIKPAGWSIVDHASVSIGRTIKGSYTAYEIAVVCTSTYNVYLRWDNEAKTLTIYPTALAAPVGAFATKELNLKEINYKGKSNNLATRLYAYGKDGLSFASINSGKPYVDNNSYNSRIICAYWQDDRYTDAASLLADAQEKVNKIAVPERSYACSIVDLQATDPSLYGNLDFGLFKTAMLIDDVKNTAINYQVVERHIYPYHPASNEVIFDNSPQKITAEVINIQNSIDNPNSTFQQIQDSKISAATDWLLSGDGYCVAVKNANGEWQELLFMDTDNISTAQDVLRINKNGIGFSRTGANGPYTNAWTIDGNLVADFITTGTMLADRIRGGTLEVGGYGNQNGVIKVYSAISLGSGTYTPPTIPSVPFGYAEAGMTGAFNVDIVVSNISDPSHFKGYFLIRKTVDGSTFTDVANGVLVEGVNRINYTFDIINDGNNYYMIYVYRYSSSYTASYNYDVVFNKPETVIDNNGIVTSNITALAGYIGNGTYGFTIKDTYIANKLTSVGDTSQDGAYYGINGMAVNAAGKHSHVMGTEIWTQGTLGAKGFTIGDMTGSSYNTIKGRFDNTNGMTLTSTPDSHSIAFIHTNGGYVPITGGSDRRLKENIKEVSIDQIRELFAEVEPVQFNYKYDELKQTEYGLIAQDLEKALKAVGMDNTGLVAEREGEEHYKIIMYHRMVGLLIPAVKDLYIRIEALENELKELKKDG